MTICRAMRARHIAVHHTEQSHGAENTEVEHEEHRQVNMSP